MKFLFLALLLASCANIQKATNVHAITEDNQNMDSQIKTLASEADASSCKFVSNVKGEDNLLNVGRESAVISMKKFAYAKAANAVWVESCTETKTAIQAITVCKGKIYDCPK